MNVILSLSLLKQQQVRTFEILLILEVGYQTTRPGKNMHFTNYI